MSIALEGLVCRGNGATERELEALAIYMGHSMEMQRGTYDRQALVALECTQTRYLSQCLCRSACLTGCK